MVPRHVQPNNYTALSDGAQGHDVWDIDYTADGLP